MTLGSEYNQLKHALEGTRPAFDGSSLAGGKVCIGMNVTRVGKFALEGTLGSQNSSVYRAFHVEQKRQVAVKLFSEFAEANSHARAYLSDEMQVLRRLKHKNIATCHGGAFDKQHGFVVWELVEGETLADALERRGRFPPEQALSVAMQIAAALEAALDLGVTHLDLTPDKVMLTPSGAVKVLDFRRERAVNPYAQSWRRRTLLRAQYLAPEQQQSNSGELTTKADLYSLGCLLFAMLAGQPPFTGDSPEEIAAKHLTETPPRVGQLVLDCPVWLDALTAQLLERDPLQRPHAPAAVKLALQEAKRRMASGAGVTQHALGGISALKLGTDREEARKLVGQKRRRPGDDTPLHERPWFIAVALVGMLCVAAAALTFALWPANPEQQLAEAERLLATDDVLNWAVARDVHLKPLLERDPEGPLAGRARELLDQVAADTAKLRVEKLARLGLPTKNESERLLVEAFRMEDFGDKAGALQKYQSLVDLLKPEGEDRAYVHLAQKQIAAIRAGSVDETKERAAFIKAKLDEADALVANGQRLEALKIWHSIISLYGDDQELAGIIGDVRDKIAERDSKPAAEKSNPGEDTSEDAEPVSP